MLFQACYDLARLKAIYAQLADDPVARKHAFHYYVFIYTGISVYHADLLNISLTSIFLPPKKQARFFDLQELEHRFTARMERDEERLDRIGIKINTDFEINPDCDISPETKKAIKKIIYHFSIKTQSLLALIHENNLSQWGIILLELKQWIDSTHRNLQSHLINTNYYQPRFPKIQPIIEALIQAYHLNELDDAIINLARLRLTPETIQSVTLTLNQLPIIRHQLFFQSLFNLNTPATKALIDVKMAVLKHCDSVQQALEQDQDWINTNPLIAIHLQTLIQLTVKKYRHNNRYFFQRNRRYLALEQTTKNNSLTPAVLLGIILHETGRFGCLQPDSFFCLLLVTAKQEHCLALFDEYLPKDDAETPFNVDHLTAPKPAWWQRWCSCFNSGYEDLGAKTRHALLAHLKKSRILTA